MSVAEIKAELTKLTPEERREIAAVLEQLETVSGEEETAPRVRRVVSGVRMNRQDAMDHIFSHYGNLLERLAK